MDKDKGRTNFRRLLSLLLCLMMLSAMPVSALADDAATDAGIINAQKLNEMTESFLSERGIDPKIPRPATNGTITAMSGSTLPVCTRCR